MPLPTVEGETSLSRYACDYFWVYTESDAQGGVSVSVDGGDPVAAVAGTDKNDVDGWKFLVAGSLCPTPGAGAIIATPGLHEVHAWQTNNPQTHAFSGSILIT